LEINILSNSTLQSAIGYRGRKVTKRDFAFNIKIFLSLLLSAVISVGLFEFGFIDDDLYVQFVLVGFFGFALFRVVAPYVFTKMDPHGTPEMQKNMRRHPLGRFFLIED